LFPHLLLSSLLLLQLLWLFCLLLHQLWRHFHQPYAKGISLCTAWFFFFPISTTLISITTLQMDFLFCFERTILLSTYKIDLYHTMYYFVPLTCSTATTTTTSCFITTGLLFHHHRHPLSPQLSHRLFFSSTSRFSPGTQCDTPTWSIHHPHSCESPLASQHKHVPLKYSPALTRTYSRNEWFCVVYFHLTWVLCTHQWCFF